jgi:hypothetical protein
VPPRCLRFSGRRSIRKGSLVGGPGPPHHMVARSRGTRATLWCGLLAAHLRLPFRLTPSFINIRCSVYPPGTVGLQK